MCSRLELVALVRRCRLTPTCFASPAGRQGTKAGRARFCLRIHAGIKLEILPYSEARYFHREPLRAGVAAPHPYFQKGIRESAKSKRRESVRAAPKRLRQQVATERSDSDGRERQARVGSTYLLRLCDELRERERASALSAVFSK